MCLWRGRNKMQEWESGSRLMYIKFHFWFTKWKQRIYYKFDCVFKVLFLWRCTLKYLNQSFWPFGKICSSETKQNITENICIKLYQIKIKIGDDSKYLFLVKIWIISMKYMDKFFIKYTCLYKFILIKKIGQSCI